MCLAILISYLDFKAVLALPKTACSAQTHKSISFIRIVWSTLYVYLCLQTGNAPYDADWFEPTFQCNSAWLC